MVPGIRKYKNKLKTKEPKEPKQMKQTNRQNRPKQQKQTKKIKPEVIVPPLKPEKAQVKGCHNIRVKPMNCNPAKDGQQAVDGSCLTPTVLMQLKDSFNRKNPNNQIVATDPRQIWQQLHDHIHSCSDEICWLDVINDGTARSKIKDALFAPNQPDDWADNPNEWLSNYDIFHVLRQYEEKYPDFEFIGPTTIDFDAKPTDMGGKCVEEELCKISLKSLVAKNKTKIGVIFNLDKHDEDGSHWVSLYVDMNEGIIFFFDSAGGGLPVEIRRLMKRLMAESEQSGKNPLKMYNNGSFRHQYGANECGMYSLFFIITMLTGKTHIGTKTAYIPMEERIRLFLKKRIPDKVIHDYRDLYFNPPVNKRHNRR